MLHCVPTELHSEADLCSLFIGRTLRCVIISTLYSWMEDSVVKVLRLRGSPAYVGYGSTKVDSTLQLHVCVCTIHIYISVHEKSCDDVLCTTTVGLFVCLFVFIHPPSPYFVCGCGDNQLLLPGTGCFTSHRRPKKD